MCRPLIAPSTTARMMRYFCLLIGRNISRYIAVLSLVGWLRVVESRRRQRVYLIEVDFKAYCYPYTPFCQSKSSHINHQNLQPYETKVKKHLTLLETPNPSKSTSYSSKNYSWVIIKRSGRTSPFALDTALRRSLKNVGVAWKTV